MNCDNAKVILKEKNFYNILYIIVPIKDLSSYLSTQLNGVLNKYLANKKNIYEVNLKRFEEDNKAKVEITIKFYKFNIAEFKAKSERDKIVTALNLLGFEDKDILYVYRDVKNIYKHWVIGVKPKEKFDDDDEFLDKKVQCEFDIQNQLRDLLKFSISFEFDYDYDYDS